MSERKDFEPWKVEIVFQQQDGVCKCSNPLGAGFHRHHKDGDKSNNSVENLELLCMHCHGGEAYQTLVKRKRKFLKNIDTLFDLAVYGKVTGPEGKEKTVFASGAVIDKLTDLIKLGLSLNSQINGYEVEKTPASVKMQNYLVSSGLLLKQYEEGIREGIRIGVKIGCGKDCKVGSD